MKINIAAKFLLFSLLSFFLPVCYANQLEAQYIQKAHQVKLAQNKTWQRLMYAKKNGQSEVGFKGFFYSAKGQQNLKAELDANIHELFVLKEKNESIQCRFPARTAWIIQQLKIPQHEIPVVNCPELDDWLGQIKPYKVNLIFATDYMGSPSSMFGHTLLRLDPQNQKELNLISYAVNYSAMANDAESFAFAWKGLTGQYDGEYSLMPYYRKVKEYGDLESRDLWEYELALNPDETKMLVKHIWELKQVNFPYYFINDNCSYRLLGLIDLVKPEANLQSQFNYAAIPIETIKAIYKQGLIKESVYRPALETQLLDQAKQHGYQLAKIANTLTTLEPQQVAPTISRYGKQDQAKILEMAYDHLYLKLIAKKVDADIAQPRIREILSLRSRLDITKQRTTVPEPEINPIHGHKAASTSFEIGRVQQDNFVQLNHRVAYHDLIDPQGGYRLGTQLKFLDSSFQYRDQRLKVHTIDILELNSFNPLTPFKLPVSWGFNVGWRQESLNSEGRFSEKEQHGVLNISSQMGFSLADRKRENLCYAQLKNYLQFGKALDQGWRLGIGPSIGCQTIWPQNFNTIVQLDLPYWEDQHQWGLKFNSAIQKNINQDNAIRLNYKFEQQDDKHWSQLSLGLIHYH